MATTPASRNAATEGLGEPNEKSRGLVLSKMKTKKENENEKKTKEKKNTKLTFQAVSISESHD